MHHRRRENGKCGLPTHLWSTYWIYSQVGSTFTSPSSSWRNGTQGCPRTLPAGLRGGGLPAQQGKCWAQSPAWWRSACCWKRQFRRVFSSSHDGQHDAAARVREHKRSRPFACDASLGGGSNRCWGRRWDGWRDSGWGERWRVIRHGGLVPGTLIRDQVLPRQVELDFFLVRVPRKCCLSYFSFFLVVLRSPHGSRSRVEPEEPKYCQRL